MSRADAIAQELPPRYPYRPRASFCGTVLLLCPRCGHVAYQRIARTQWYITCKMPECRARYAVGLTLHALGPVNTRQKPLPPEDVTFPQVTLQAYQPGGRVHEAT